MQGASGGAARLLLVEDEPGLLEQNRRHLERQGYEVLCAATLCEARAALRQTPPDLILLDVLMPDGNGYDFCAEIRPHTSAPILFLTSMDQAENIIHGLMGGGDDYITKPFDMNVLSARIVAQLRRAGRAGRISVPPLMIDLQSGQATLRGENLRLTQKELQLLAFFAGQMGKEFSVDDLYAAVWNDASVGAANTVRKHISSLRKKLSGEGGQAPFQISFTHNDRYVFRQLVEEPEW